MTVVNSFIPTPTFLFVLERCNLSVFDLFLIDTDVEPTPDVLWPNAKEILCSAVSRCSRHVALGLDGALVCVWDRQSGEQMLRWRILKCYQILPHCRLAVALQFIGIILIESS